MKNQKSKIIIVGGGISGISIALRLLERNIDFKLIDSGKNYSSSIAAGIINPVVFRRMALSWNASEFIPKAKKFYSELEKKWNVKFHYPIQIRRAFAHQQEVELWKTKQELNEYQDFIEKISEDDMNFPNVINTYGTGRVKNSSYVDAPKFMEAAHLFLQKNNRISYQNFAYEDLNLEKSTYLNETFNSIIFCEGYSMIYNPWFDYLPLQATKGEILTISSNQIPEKESLNRKCFILPIGNNQFKLGATYSWDDTDLATTETAKETLLNQAKSLISFDFSVEKHVAGIRPTVKDRRPLLGRHTKHDNLYLFNGLGTKGYMLAPQLSQEFVAFLLDDVALDNEVNIERFAAFNP
jgi:glycine oxidase